MHALRHIVRSCVLALLAAGALPASLASVTEPAPLTVTSEHRQAAGLIVHLMTNYHYLKAPLDDELSAEILTKYLDSMDPDRLIFLQRDINAFQAYRRKFDDFLRAGYVKPAFEIFRIFRTRVAEREEFALSLLSHDFDFDRDEAFRLRDEKSAWAGTPAALDELWRKRVKNDLLSLLISGRSIEQARETLTKRYQGIVRRAQQLTANDVFQLFMNAYTTSVEPHTAYFSPRTSENFKIRMSLSLEGIGAALQSEDEHTVVRRIIPGGPADLGDQLQVDDRIVGVAQGEDGEMIDVVSWRLEDVVDLIRGPKGTVVRLEVRHKDAGTEGPTDFITLVRNKIKLEDQAAQKSIIDLGENGRHVEIGVIDVPTFYLDMGAMARGEKNYRSTTRDVRRLIHELEGEGVSGIIIDLRGNGGGSLVEATELTGLFIASGPVVQVRDSSGRVKVNDDPDPGIAYDGALAVLVDGQSASASEIFAGAIQDYNRGIVVGAPTYGKGTVQNVVDLNRFVGPDIGKLGQLKVTIAQFFRVSGDSTQHRGVVPDIVLPFVDGADDTGERALKNALPWATISPASYRPFHGLGSTIATLRRREQRRVASDPGFNYLREENRVRRTVQEQKTVSLLESRRKAEIDAREQASEARLNTLRIARGLKPLGEEGETAPEKDEDTFDILLDETVRILTDFIDVGSDPVLIRAELENRGRLTAEKEPR